MARDISGRADDETKTLGLDDLGFGALIQSLEETFDLTIGDAEAGRIKSVGDLEAIVSDRFASSEVVGSQCATAMAFYRLRRALAAMGIEAPLAPETRLDDITALPARKLLNALSRGLGLRLPRFAGTRISDVAGWFIIVAFVAFLPMMLVAAHFGLPAVAGVMVAIAATFAFGFALGSIDPGILRPDCQTMAGLSRKVAGLNFGTLHARGAKARHHDVWNALIEVLTEAAPRIAKHDIDLQTLLLEDML